MDSTKNFFDAWMNTQTKFVDNLVDTSKQISSSLKQGDVIEKSAELYHTWFTNQKELRDDMLDSLQNSTDGKSSEFLKNWMESQMELGKKWMDLLHYATGKEHANGEWSSQIEHIQKLYNDWNAIYNQLFNQFGKPLTDLDYTPGNLTKHTFAGFIDNTRTYMKMFELWQPIYKMLQSNTLGIDYLNKVLDMDKYREVIDGVFHFMDFNKSQGFVDMMQKYQEVILDSSSYKNIFSTPITDLLQQFQPSILLDKNFNTLSKMSYDFSEQFNKFVQPYYTMIPAGREKEMLGVMIQIQENYSKYYIKGVEMQNLVYVAAQKSIETSVYEIMKKSHEKSELTNFDEFYAIWVNTLEEDTIALFGSNKYAALQGDLLKLGLGIKSQLDKLMEHMLAPLPVVPRSEVDEINATLYELKSKVRNLEKQLKNTNKEK